VRAHCEAERDPDWPAIVVGGVLMRDAVSTRWRSVDERTADHMHLPCMYKTSVPHKCNPSCMRGPRVVLSLCGCARSNTVGSSSSLHCDHTTLHEIVKLATPAPVLNEWRPHGQSRAALPPLRAHCHPPRAGVSLLACRQAPLVRRTLPHVPSPAR
jgi:hypothetical protein